MHIIIKGIKFDVKVCQSTAFGIWFLLSVVCWSYKMIYSGYVVLWTRYPVYDIRCATIYHRNRFAFRILVSVSVWINYNAVFFSDVFAVNFVLYRWLAIRNVSMFHTETNLWWWSHHQLGTCLIRDIILTNCKIDSA